MKYLISIGALLALSAPLHAASITNNDDVPRTVVVTDGGSQQELSLAAGESAEFCPNGCFVSIQGEREALMGNEAVEIRGGRMRVR